ncbi:membrane-spanning 4-domains subfamily A member 4D-like [Lepisosteus oculatus]|uniref:Membrane-spanning 4-domains subfamily A member 4A-like n=1 Tax=Lepisosteus oculatus TaxID=7918 RepID=W5LW96_LEPOC|nr:PREDICTED: membrane-spanning 4-domains subfamily A member 4A-like [Lepisosteus oculatus]XP_015194574.1 PREDICTED: membrane-spanning 4-domains subfamily A member 4A-like [Lepisosteus oculatus]XP_015194575.1 PREDICTED: membrane-spanning 4-domains subfamily A member 4A-like [Lepisosteus oculatus]
MSASITTSSGLVIVTQVLPQGGDLGIPQPADPRNQAVTSYSERQNQTAKMLKKLLKGGPKALGTVQILIGVLNLMMGLLLVFTKPTMVTFFGVPFWTGAMYIISGSLSVASHKGANIHMIKGTIAMNIISCIMACVAIVFLCIDLSMRHSNCWPWSSFTYEYRDCQLITFQLNAALDGIRGILLIYSVVELCVALSICVFGCKAVHSNSGDQMSVVLVQHTGDPMTDPELARSPSESDVPLLDSEEQPHTSPSCSA